MAAGRRAEASGATGHPQGHAPRPLHPQAAPTTAPSLRWGNRLSCPRVRPLRPPPGKPGLGALVTVPHERRPLLAATQGTTRCSDPCPPPSPLRPRPRPPAHHLRSPRDPRGHGKRRWGSIPSTCRTRPRTPGEGSLVKRREGPRVRWPLLGSCAPSRCPDSSPHSPGRPCTGPQGPTWSAPPARGQEEVLLPGQRAGGPSFSKYLPPPCGPPVRPSSCPQPSPLPTTGVVRCTV